MDYQQTLQYLRECAKLGSRPGLVSIRELLTRLQNPQDKLDFIHVAGTNGKGSVASFVASVLGAAGYRVGFFASPWVYRITETLCINGQEISQEELAGVISRTRIAADAMPEDGFAHPTEFEILTAAAYLYFREQSCDCVVVEAGMGGRLDATNATSTTAISVLTKIDYDHQGFLGDTLADITREKCGILRKEMPVISYPLQEEEVSKEIKRQAELLSCPQYMPALSRLMVHEETLSGSVFSYKSYKNLKITLCGKHQILNAITAIEAVEALASRGFNCLPEQLKQGLRQAKWPGRFEVLSQDIPVILDGAHNVNGAKAFVDTVQAVLPKRDFIGVVGMLRDKDYESCFKLFAGVCSSVIVTEVPNPRAEKAEVLAEAAQRVGLNATVMHNPAQAVSEALSARKADQGVFCVGSLYALAFYKKAYFELSAEN